MNKNSNGKVINFLRKNGLYLLLAFCILAIGLSIALSLVNREKPLTPDNGEVNSGIENENPDDAPSTEITPPEDDKPVVEVITFIMPVNDCTSIVDYSDTMVFNQTLNRFSSHKAIDFFAAEGTSVFAVYDGEVVNVEDSILHGVTITIEHGNGLKTLYNSVEDGSDVYIGKKVKQGDVIGSVSTTNRQEHKDGSHLHFSVMENDQVIDPAKYLAIDEK